MKFNSCETVHMLVCGYNTRMETKTFDDLVCQPGDPQSMHDMEHGGYGRGKEEIPFGVWNSVSAEYLACPKQRYEKNISLVPTVIFFQCHSKQKKT